jgi:predicted anti-sigma-YlaC factor YlaD
MHLGRCEACRLKYAPDLALIDVISEAPEPEYPTVAVEAVRIARARMKRLALLKWGGVAAVVSLVVAVMGSLGSGLPGVLADLLTAAVGTRPDLGVGRALLSVLVSVGESVRELIFGGALVRELAPLMPQIIVSAIGLGLVAVFLMYVMGLWLRKPGRVRS